MAQKKWNKKEVFERADYMLSGPYRLIAVCRYKNKNYVFASYHVDDGDPTSFNPEKFLFEEAPGHMGHWNHFLWNAEECLKEVRDIFPKVGWSWMLPTLQDIAEQKMPYRKGVDSMRSHWVDRHKIYGNEQKRLDEYFVAKKAEQLEKKQSAQQWHKVTPARSIPPKSSPNPKQSLEYSNPLVEHLSPSSASRQKKNLSAHDMPSQGAVNQSAWQALPMTRVDWLAMFTLFRQNYFSHFFLQSLVCFLFLQMLPSPWGGLSIFFILVCLLISSSERLLTGSPMFDEISFWRPFYRFLNVASFMALAPLVGIVICIPFMVIGVATGLEEWLVGLAFAAWSGFCLLRCWPILVIQYIYRYSEADYWSKGWHIKFPDIGLSYRLTAAPNTLLWASLPVLSVSLLPLIGYIVLDYWASSSAILQLSFTSLYCFLFLPFAILIMVERAVMLANHSESAWSGALYVAQRGNFWFVK